MLPPQVELIRPAIPLGGFKLALFDFDGTLSLLREGWSVLMAQMGQERIGPHYSLAGLEREMLLLSGKPSIFQMQKIHDLAVEVGQSCPAPQELLLEFIQRLKAISGTRLQSLQDGTAPPQQWAVPGSHEFLNALQARGVHLVLASGTPIQAVAVEAELLGLTPFFGKRIHAPDGLSPNFSKRAVLEATRQEFGVLPKEVIGFGDGYSETVEVKALGGFAVGLATVQPGETGVHTMKRDLLVELGADAIIPNYEPVQPLVQWLFGETL